MGAVGSLEEQGAPHHERRHCALVVFGHGILDGRTHPVAHSPAVIAGGNPILGNDLDTRPLDLHPAARDTDLVVAHDIRGHASAGHSAMLFAAFDDRGNAASNNQSKATGIAGLASSDKWIFWSGSTTS